MKRRTKPVIFPGVRLRIQKLPLQDLDKGDVFLERLHERTDHTVFYVERPNGAIIVLVPNPFTKYGRWIIELLVKEFGWRQEPMGNAFIGPFGRIMTNWSVQDVQQDLTDFRR